MTARVAVPRLPDRPWDAWVRRVILHVPDYLSADGDPTSGGRQRNVRDIARLIRHVWRRQCVIVQKARTSFEAEDGDGTRVVGVPSRLSVWGDPGFGLATSRLVEDGDALVYVGGEDAWPFIVRGAKALHAGVWWDGPISRLGKRMTAHRTESLFRVCRSVLCVDTNVINWLRARSARNQMPANRAIYVPNCADLERLPPRSSEVPSKNGFTILFTRRFDYRRGPYLALDAIERLRERGADVQLIMSTAEGHAGSREIREAAAERGVGDSVTTVEHDLDSVLELYRTADVALVPTIWSEGTSYSCVEALVSGLPVVTTTVGGLPNLVVPGFNGFVVPPAPGPLAEAIERLMDPTLWSQLHQNALSMRPALSKSKWDERVLQWLKA